MAELVDRARHHGRDVILVGHVGAHRDGARTGRVRGIADQLFTSRGQQHLCAFPDEQRTQHGSQAGACPGDDRDLAVKPACHYAVFPG